MRFYHWSILAYRDRQENHVFNSQFGSDDHFTSLCGRKVHGYSGENSKQYYCPTCKEKSVGAEAQAQAKEEARIAKLELKRASTLIKMSAILEAMPIDSLLSLHLRLKQK